MTAQNIKDFNIATGVGAPSTAVASLVKAWESKTTQRALRGSSLGLMAVSLAACGGSDDAATDGGSGGGTTTAINKFFTLEPTDALVGTDSNDTFNGVVDGLLDGTIQTGDSAIGGLGNGDVLNVYVQDGNGGFPGGVSISGIEIINLYQEQDTIDGLDTRDFVGATQVWQIDRWTWMTVGSDVTAGFKNVEFWWDNLGITAATGVTDINVVFDNAMVNGYFSLEFYGSDVTTVSVTGDFREFDAGDTIDFDIHEDGTAISSLNLALSSDQVIDIELWDLNDLETLDAGSSTADLYVHVETGYFGMDSSTDVDLTTDHYHAVLTSVALGDGDDTLFLSTGYLDNELSITLGAGEDTLIFDADGESGYGNLIVASGDIDTNSLIHVTDFQTDDLSAIDPDTLDLSNELNSDQFNFADVTVDFGAGGDTLDEALDAALLDVDGVWNPGEAVAFVYNGDTYIYIDTNDVGIDTGDSMIVLEGVTNLDSSDLVLNQVI